MKECKSFVVVREVTFLDTNRKLYAQRSVRALLYVILEHAMRKLYFFLNKG